MAALSAAALEGREHPSPDMLLAYQAGQLADDDQLRLQEHLAWCSQCARTVVDLASWPDVKLLDPVLERTVTEEADDWQAIQRHIASDVACVGDSVAAPVPLALPRRAVPPPRGSSQSYGPIHLLAAALLLAVVGLSYQVAKLSRGPAPQARMAETLWANLFIIDLEPAGSGSTRNPEAGRSGTSETVVPAGMETVVFLLVQDDLRRFADHAVELSGADGKVFWQTGGLVSLPEGGFSLAVPLAAVPSTEIEIRLYGDNGGKRELLSSYRTRIRRSVLP